MLHLFHGPDIDARNAAKDALLAGAIPVRFSAGEWDSAAIEKTAGEARMFGGPSFAIIDGVSDTEDGRKMIVEQASRMADSSNIFIILALKATKDFIRRIEKAGGSIQSFDSAAKEPKKKEGNPFALADSFSARDKRVTWARMIEALEEGAAPESIAGTLFWAAKSMFLAKRCKGAEEAGMHPFAFAKASRAAAKFSEKELLSLMTGLKCLYHDAHAGRIDFPSGLETFILESL